LDDTSSLPESESDVLFVRNDSASALSYFCVSGEDNEWFYILNLAPHASLKLYARPQWKRTEFSPELLATIKLNDDRARQTAISGS
jgi:hypothetical protein